MQSKTDFIDKKETWVSLDIGDGHYEISNLGKVRSMRRLIITSNGHRQTINAKMLTPTLNNYGYPKVRIRVDKKQFNLVVHLYVAKHFVVGYKKGLQVNHIDGDKTNNNSKNLEWVTCKENIRHAWKIGLCDNSWARKPVSYKGRAFESLQDLADFLAIDRRTVSSRINSKNFSEYAWITA